MKIDIPEVTFVAIEGKGNTNDKDGEYQKVLEIIYGVQYTIKMSKNGKILENKVRLMCSNVFITQITYTHKSTFYGCRLHCQYRTLDVILHENILRNYTNY